MCLFPWDRIVGLKGQFLLSENMAKRQSKAGHFASYRGRTVLSRPLMLSCGGVSLFVKGKAIEPRIAVSLHEKHVYLPVILSLIHSPVVYSDDPTSISLPSPSRFQLSPPCCPRTTNGTFQSVWRSLCGMEVCVCDCRRIN